MKCIKYCGTCLVQTKLLDFTLKHLTLTAPTPPHHTHTDTPTHTHWFKSTFNRFVEILWFISYRKSNLSYLFNQNFPQNANFSVKWDLHKFPTFAKIKYCSFIPKPKSKTHRVFRCCLNIFTTKQVHKQTCDWGYLVQKSSQGCAALMDRKISILLLKWPLIKCKLWFVLSCSCTMCTGCMVPFPKFISNLYIYKEILKEN